MGVDIEGLRRMVLDFGDREAAIELKRECGRRGVFAFGNYEMDYYIFQLFDFDERSYPGFAHVLRLHAITTLGAEKHMPSAVERHPAQGEVRITAEVTSENRAQFCRLLASLPSHYVLYFRILFER